MDTRNQQNDLFQKGIDRTQEANWDPILGYHMYFPNDENKDQHLDEKDNLTPTQNTGDWGDDADYEELRHKNNFRRDIAENDATKTD
ncbi:MAG: hypothetical protein J7574_07260 [Flavobacterium sp.]|uniref:hypothetical protein n=1 Tax=Flavobacterium sp. TaxID=239 RepID=UPI001B09ABE0|nr:hypothetical protein [Flavobacterium sp.]MBO9583939.1 hypothetical protein [Flavobacterium sp.]